MKRRWGIPVVKFYGHEAFPGGLFPNITLGIMAPLLIRLSAIHLHNAVLPWWYIYGHLWWSVLLMPSSMYLFLEIKHIVLDDGIADGRPWPAVVAFSLMSLLGLLSGVANVLVAVHMFPLLAENYYISIAAVSFLSALGGVMGLLDITSLFGFVFPPLAVMYAMKVLMRRSLLLLTVCLTAMLSMLSIAADIAYTALANGGMF